MAAFPSAAALPAPPAVRLGQRRPDPTVKVREAEPLDCFGLLFSGDADLAVVEAMRENPLVNDRRFEQRPLLDDPFDLLTRRATGCAGKRGPGLRALGLPALGLPALGLCELAAGPRVFDMPGSACSHVSSCCPPSAPRGSHRRWRTRRATGGVVAALVAQGSASRRCRGRPGCPRCRTSCVRPRRDGTCRAGGCRASCGAAARPTLGLRGARQCWRR